MGIPMHPRTMIIMQTIRDLLITCSFLYLIYYWKWSGYSKLVEILRMISQVHYLLDAGIMSQV